MGAIIKRHRDENGNPLYYITSSAAVGMSDGSGSLDAKFIELNKLSAIPYFAFYDLKILNTTNQISFKKYSFLYLKDTSGSNLYKRYIIADGSYDIPTELNKAIVVSLEKKDSNGYLIPYITDNSISSTSDIFYIIGYTDSAGNFTLCENSYIQKIALSAQETATSAQETATSAKEIATSAQETATSAKEIATSAKGEIDSISNLFSDNKIQISDDILKKNVTAYLKNDGTLITEGLSGNYIVVSDFIEIKGNIKNIKTCFNKTSQNSSCVGLAFYSDKTEESFISAFKEYTEEIQYGWVKYDGDVTIPVGAKYLRVAGNTTLYKESPNVEMYEKIITEENVYSDAPSLGYEYFTFDVDTAKEDIEDEIQSTNILDSSVISKDNGFIRLPESYNKKGKPTRLVIVNHGAGGQVTSNSSENGNTSFVLLLQKKGYAVLCINGVPENMRNTDYMNAAQNGAATHMGGWIYMRSALAAYKYVTEKYNIAKDGCFIVGRSMGGVTSLNLAMSGVMPVKALALDAPVIDTFHDAYFSGGWSGGTLDGKTAAIFPWIYQWDYCDFDNNTYTIPKGEYNIYGQSYNVQTEETKSLATLKDNQQDMAILWYLNENKMYGYNAYKTGDFLVKNLDEGHFYNLSADNDEQYYGKKLPCPCKIWFGSGDTVNQIDIAKRFIKKIRNGGTIAVLRTCPTNRHTIWNELETMPEGTDISVIEDGIKCSPYGVELWNWIKRWDGKN